MAVLYNISNHPYRRWSEAQKAAAFTFADYVEDVQFPEVPSMADEEEVRVIAAELLAKADIPYGALVNVAGEVTMAYALVAMLQEHGCTCFAAVTERDFQDGKLRYEFQQFRKYPTTGSVMQLGDMIGYSGDYAVAELGSEGFVKVADSDKGMEEHLTRELAGIGATQTDHGPVPVFVVR